MARPKTKEDLVFQSQNNYMKLLPYIDVMPDINKELPPGYLNRNVRDVLAHVHHWHTMMLDWYDIGIKGGSPDMTAKGYTWRTVPDLNRIIWKKYTSTSFDKVRRLLEESYMKLQTIIKSHIDEDLFTKKKYKWTGSTSLAAYLISATSSHYDWPLRLIKN